MEDGLRTVRRINLGESWCILENQYLGIPLKIPTPTPAPDPGFVPGFVRACSRMKRVRLYSGVLSASAKY